MCNCQVSRKINIFCGLYKKEKIYPVNNIIFSTEFCLFYTRHITSPFFMKQLCERVALEDVRANFLFQFFEIQNICKMKFKMEGAYAPMFQNTNKRIQLVNSK
jgi:hypothetical protein